MASPLDHLENANFELEHNDPMQEVNQALAACTSALDVWAEGSNWRRPLTVSPRPVVYESVHQRDQQFNLYLDRNPNLAGTYMVEEWEEEKKAYGIVSDAVSKANQRNSIFYMVSMQSPVFSHSWHKRHWGEDTPELR